MMNPYPPGGSVFAIGEEGNLVPSPSPNSLPDAVPEPMLNPVSVGGLTAIEVDASTSR